MSKVSFIIVSKDGKFALDDSMIHSVMLNHGANADGPGDVQFIKFAYNKLPLTQIYNQQLEHYRTNPHDNKIDFLVFMHADVKLDVESFLSHLDECKDKYDVIGLCGCSKISVSQSPLNWFCGSRPYPNDRWGCVTHGELGNQTSFFSSHSPSVRDHEVACIDGLCIVFGKKALQSDMTFDETFQFDQYDTDISFQSVMQKNLRLGVIVEKSLQHYSVGRSILSKDFLKHELDFRKKWNLEIPENSSLQMLASKV